MKENNWVISFNEGLLMLECKQWRRYHMGRDEVRLVYCAMFYSLNDAEEYVRFKSPCAHVIVTEGAQSYSKAHAE